MPITAESHVQGMSEDEREALKCADDPAPRVGSFRINGRRDCYSLDCVHEELFGISLVNAVINNRWRADRKTATKDDPQTADMVFSVFKYNVMCAPLSTAVDGAKFAELKMVIPRSIVDMLGEKAARKVEEPMIQFRRPSHWPPQEVNTPEPEPLRKRDALEQARKEGRVLASWEIS